MDIGFSKWLIWIVTYILAKYSKNPVQHNSNLNFFIEVLIMSSPKEKIEGKYDVCGY